MIESGSNAQIKHLTQLQKKAKTREETGTFLGEGKKFFEECLALQKRNGQTILEKVYFAESLQSSIKEPLSVYAGGTPYELVKDSVFLAVAETVTPQGVLCIVKRRTLCIRELQIDSAARFLILEDVRDPGNLGTMLRTAEAAGMTGVIMSEGCVDVYNPKVVRSTMGSILRVPFFTVSSLPETVNMLRSAGVTVYAAALNASVPYNTLTYEGAGAIVIGNEAAGLSDEMIALADHVIRIPMCGMVESLNAAIAAAILMYQIKQ